MVAREYLAGFFDADGAVGITRGSGTSYFLLWVAVSQVEPAPLHLFKDRYGGKIHGPVVRQGNARPIYQWKAESQVAENFLRDVVDDLVVKRERTLLALEFRTLFKGENILPRGPSVDRFPEKRAQVIQLRWQMFEQMAQLNKRGVA